MGGCASKPKDLDSQQAPVPVDNPEKAEGQTVPHESTNEAESKKEEPLVDVSEPAKEAPRAEDATPEPMPASTESSQADSSNPTEVVKAQAATEPTTEEKKEVVADEVSKESQN